MDSHENGHSAPTRVSRILLLMMSIGLALLLLCMFFVEGFLYIHTPFALIAFAFISTIVLSAILPYFSLRKRATYFKILILWFLLMGFGLPLLAQPYYRFITAQLLPNSPTSQVGTVSYVPYQGIKGGGPYVAYLYQTTNQKQDYSKMKELYESEFDNNTWIKSDGDETITFSKANNGTPRVTLKADERTPDLIEVRVAFQ